MWSFTVCQLSTDNKIGVYAKLHSQFYTAFLRFPKYIYFIAWGHIIIVLTCKNWLFKTCKNSSADRIRRQAPGDEDRECTLNHSSPPTYLDTERNLMDSYNYVNLLPGNGTGNDPVATAVWNDFSFDNNDITPEIAMPTYVSCFLHDL